MSVLAFAIPLAAGLDGAADTPAILLLCFVLTAGLLFYTFHFPQVSRAAEKNRQTFLSERKDVVYENLRDLNFEYRAGKYPERDYQEMRTALENEAAALLAEIEMLESGASSASGTRIVQDARAGKAGKGLSR